MSVVSEGTWESYRLKNLSNKSCYIAGKIKDCINHVELFDQAKAEISKLALVPISPLDLITSEDYIECMKVDLTVMMRCSHVYVLNNFKTSRGANLEILVAEFLGLNIIYQPETLDEVYNIPYQ